MSEWDGGGGMEYMIFFYYESKFNFFSLKGEGRVKGEGGLE